jgi:hypothetical protein
MQKHHLFIVSIIIFMGLVFGIYQYFQAFETENVSAVTIGVPNPGHTWAEIECSANSLCIDTVNNRVGIGTNNPTATLDVGGTDSIKIPIGTTSQRSVSPTNGMMRLNTTTGKLEYYNSGWNSVGGVVATGGTITEVGGYRVHTFTSSGTFTVTSGGNVEYLVVAGGGGGGAYYGAGGGGGGFKTGSLAIGAGSITVTVGAGGTGGIVGGSVGTNGGDSVFGSITSIGGGYGGGNHSPVNSTTYRGAVGGSGGGSKGNAYGVGDGTSGQGYAGGIGYSDAVFCGGGGGAGGAGGAGLVDRPGNGGVGLSSSIRTGVSADYAGGGAGGSSSGASISSHGGGAQNGGAGTLNTGGGGGGGGPSNVPGGAGGSGIVIIRYPM